MNFSFSFFPSSYIGLRLLGFLVFPISFFEKSLILCFVWIVFLLLWLFLFGSSLCFRFGRLDFHFDVSPQR